MWRSGWPAVAGRPPGGRVSGRPASTTAPNSRVVAASITNSQVKLWLATAPARTAAIENPRLMAQ